MSESDENLIQRFRRTGQPDLLETLLSRHLAAVRSTVFQMLLDHNAADDVTQDVFLRVLRGLETFDGRSQFSTWLFQIALNAVRTHFKNRGRLHVQFQNDPPEDSMTVRTEPGGCMLEAELTTEIQTALAHLAPQLSRGNYLDRTGDIFVCAMMMGTSVKLLQTRYFHMDEDKLHEKFLRYHEAMPVQPHASTSPHHQPVATADAKKRHGPAPAAGKSRMWE